MNRDLGLLFASRALRSFAQGYMAVIIPMYIAILGYGAVELGILSAVSSIVSATLALSVGVLADRFGRKLFMILISLMMAISGLVFAASHAFVVIALAAALGTFGGGGGAGRGGAWGPFYPAAQALLAEHSLALERTAVFGVLSFVGVMAGALGSLAAYLPQLLQAGAGFTLLQGYEALFLVTAAIGLAMALVVIPMRETRTLPDPASVRSATAPASPMRWGLSPQTWRIVARFMLTNTVNGFAIGMVGPFLVYWFYRRYGATAGQLGSLLFVINLVSALPFLAAGRLALRFGSVSIVVVTRLIGCAMLAAMALMPSFWMAAVMYALRTVFNTLSVPVRQSYLMGVIEPAERASAAGFSNSPSQVGTALSPFLAGYLMEHVWLGLPLEGGAVLQTVNALLYWFFFRDLRPPEELKLDELDAVEESPTAVEPGL